MVKLPENKILNISLDGVGALDIDTLLKRSTCNIWELRSQEFLLDKEDQAISIIKKLKETHCWSMPVTYSKRVIYESLPDIVMASSFWTLENILKCLEYAAANLLPCTLVVFSDSQAEVRESFFQKALEAKKQFPNVRLQIRCDWTPIEELLTFLKENDLESEWIVDLPLCIAERYGLNTEDTIITETYNSVDGLVSYDLLQKKVFGHMKSPVCRECQNIRTCWGYPKTNPSLRKDLKQDAKSASYKNTNELFADAYSISILEESLNPPYSSREDFPLSIRKYEFTRNLLFKRPNIISVLSLENPLYYLVGNIPEVFQKDPRGIYSINLPFIGKDLVEKNNLLKQKSSKEYFLSANGFAISSTIEFSPFWDFPTQKTLETLILDTAETVISEYGNPEYILRKERDILYRGYRVVAGAWKFIPNAGLEDNVVFYCEEIEREYESLLQPKKRINVNRGITEMVPTLTKEVFIKEMKTRLTEAVKCLK